MLDRLAPASASHRQLLLLPLVLAPAIVAAIYHQHTYWAYLCDDAFISFRYAANLIDGHGLVFNAGERCEGYSNFLWTVMLAGWHALGVDLVSAARVCGIGSLAGLVLYAVLLYRRLSDGNPLGAAAVGVFLALNAPLAYFASSGMETVFFGMLITAGCFHFVCRGRPQHFFVAVGFFTLAALTRPEGPMFLILCCCFRCVEWVVAREPVRRREAISLVAGLAVIAVFLALRFSYYGDLLPNTYYAKPQDWIGTKDFPFGGLIYTSDFLLRNGGFLLVPLVVGLLGVAELRRPVLFTLGVLAGGMLFALYANVDWMHYHRFLVPYLGLLAAPAIASIFGLLRAAAAPRWVQASVLLALVVVTGGDQVRRASIFEAREARYPNHLMTTTLLRPIGEDLWQRYRGEGTLITKRVGAVPYYSRLRTVDVFGLTDTRIAQVFRDPEKPTVRRANAARIAFTRKPDLLLSYTKHHIDNPAANTWRNLRGFYGLDRTILEQALREGFEYVAEYRSGNDEWAYLFAKPRRRVGTK